MPRPKRIKKKKSFMFTTKHHSENGILSLCLAVISLGVLIVSIILSFLNRGNVPEKMGGVGLFASVGDIIGIIAGSISLRERDIFIWIPRISLIVNIVLLLLWVGLVLGAMLF